MRNASIHDDGIGLTTYRKSANSYHKRVDFVQRGLVNFMNPKVIERELISFLVDELGLNRDSLSESTALFTSGILSSIELIQLMMMIDQKYGLSIDFGNMSIDVIDTVAKLARHVAKQAEATKS